MASEVQRLTAKSVRIGFIGAGKMANAMVVGFTSTGLVKADHITVSDSCTQMLEGFKHIGAHTVITNADVVKNSQLIFLAVKPNIVKQVLEEVSPLITKNHLVVSIAAGVKIASIEVCLPAGTRVIRVMPNTPCLVQAGASVVAPGTGALPPDSQLVVELMRSVGFCELGSEKMLDAVTGLSGSGPAYVFAAIDALADGGVKMGLARDLALKLAAQTMLGAAKMVVESGRHPGELKDEVCSPGGTTIFAMHALEKNGFRSALIDAVEAGALRAKELGDLN